MRNVTVSIEMMQKKEETSMVLGSMRFPNFCVLRPFLETKPNIPRETNWVLGGEW